LYLFIFLAKTIGKSAPPQVGKKEKEKKERAKLGRTMNKIEK
jgi:hypothetical protein